MKTIENLLVKNPPIEILSIAENENITLLESDMDWLELFKKHIANQIDEKLFYQVFKKYHALNVSWKALISMVILKEAFGWSDDQLFGKKESQLKLKIAIDINNALDIPSKYVFEAFLKMLKDFKKENKTDLIKSTIEKLADHEGPVFRVGEKRLMLWATQVA